jgi:4-diphosphocytidyl-2-C-methyl-D-erythritol kinase
LYGLFAKDIPLITLYAHAKINLGLRIIGTLPDGYHAIHSLFLPIYDLFDTLTFENHATDIIFISNDELNIPMEQNLIVKSAHLMRKHFGIQKGAIIHLDKVIPSGAGLGGGSSDAAATFRGLTKLWEITTDIPTLSELGLSLGSDIPFFFHDSPAIVEGKGEIITPISCDLHAWLLFIFPGIHINTGWAYSQIQEYSDYDMINLKSAIQNGSINLQSEQLINDFEKPIHAIHPILNDIKRQLISSGAIVSLMSGSGSTMYGIFSEESTAHSAKSAFEQFQTLIIPIRLNDTHNREDIS